MSDRSHFHCHAYGLMSVATCKKNRRLPLELRRSSSTNAPAGRFRPLSCRGCPQADEVDGGSDVSLTTLDDLERAYAHPVHKSPAKALPADSPMANVGFRAERPARPRIAPRLTAPELPRSRPASRRRGTVTDAVPGELSGGPLTARDIAQRLGCKRQSVWSALQRLCATGQVRRRSDGRYELDRTDEESGLSVAASEETGGWIDGLGSSRALRLLNDLAARRIGLPEAQRRARRALKLMGRKVPRDSWERP